MSLGATILKAKSKTIDDFLATVNPDKRATLEKLRKTIKAALPDAEECISYGIPGFSLNGKPVVWFGAGANHCAFYPSGTVLAQFLKTDLKNYDTSKGTIRFPANKPLPAALVKKLVKARLAIMDNKKAKTGKASTNRVSTSARISGPRRTPDRRSPKPASTRTDPAVINFLNALKHPQKQAIEAIRQIILSVSPDIQEGIKWNSPSFRTTEWFATLNLRKSDGKERVWLILHTGAKAKAIASPGMQIADPANLLEWLAKDRCLVTFEDEKDVEAKRKALESVLRKWIRWV